MNPEIVEMLRRVGVPANIKGYTYLKDALDMCWGDKEYIGMVTKRLYPDIAKRENTTASRVERAIRHAIGVSWDRGDLETLQKIFGCTTSADRGKPTNSEFIATLVEQLHLEYDAVPTAEGR